MIPVYFVNAFTDELFRGNPAGVCLLQHPLSEETMQKIAKEIGYSETCFVQADDLQRNHFTIRWFTPLCEVPLCGHGTLASAFVLFNLYEHLDEVYFHSKSGILPVSKQDGYMVLDFPVYKAQKAEKQYPELVCCLGLSLITMQFFQSMDSGYLLLEIKKEDLVRLRPDFYKMKQIDISPFDSLIVTSAGDERYDFYSRCFAVWQGIDEDPVTGSAHCLLIDYWQQRQPEKSTFKAYQLSERGGELLLTLKGDRVLISGKAVGFLKGNIDDII